MARQSGRRPCEHDGVPWPIEHPNSNQDMTNIDIAPHAKSIVPINNKRANHDSTPCRREQHVGSNFEVASGMLERNHCISSRETHHDQGTDASRSKAKARALLGSARLFAFVSARHNFHNTPSSFRASSCARPLHRLKLHDAPGRRGAGRRRGRDPASDAGGDGRGRSRGRSRGRRGRRRGQRIEAGAAPGGGAAAGRRQIGGTPRPLLELHRGRRRRCRPALHAPGLRQQLQLRGRGRRGGRGRGERPGLQREGGLREGPQPRRGLHAAAGAEAEGSRGRVRRTPKRLLSVA
mmetsp:Transcript_45207/g.129667  ORF Transcript_45207/g.129667 Transcript_45207/m.129667 type:complete len:293 (+) Transcript_45207:92-970(+)